MISTCNLQSSGVVRRLGFCAHLLEQYMRQRHNFLEIFSQDFKRKLLLVEHLFEAVEGN